MTPVALIALASLAAPQAGLPATVVDVYDGDTIFVDVVACPYPVLCDRVGIRLRGIDAPEIRGRCDEEREAAVRARDRLRELVEGRDVVLLAPERGRYFRLVVDVLLADGTDVGAVLLDEGLAREYDGGARRGWCS